MIGLIVAVIGMFGGGMAMGATLLGLIPGWIGIIITGVICIIVSMVFMIFNFMTGGISDVFTSARMHHNPVMVVVRNDRAIRFVESEQKEGLAVTKKYGVFILTPESTYMFPNGTTGFVSYYKYGVPLNPKFIRAVTRLREKGINDIGVVEKLNEAARNGLIKDKDGNPIKELMVNLDAPIPEPEQHPE